MCHTSRVAHVSSTPSNVNIHGSVLSYSTITTMESLPDELNCMIASYFDNGTDSGNFRLTSKYCARVGAETHFENFPFGHGTFDDAITRMQNLASSPFVKLIKSLDYDQMPEPTTSDERRDQARLLTRIARGFWAAGAPIELLQAQRLSFAFFSDEFSSEGVSDDFATTCSGVKDLSLSFIADPQVVRNRQRHAVKRTEVNLRGYMEKLEHLERLSVSYEEWDFKRTGHCLKDIVPLGRKWKRLRSIQLDWMYVDGQDLVEIMRNHADTLTCVHFSGMALRSTLEHDGRGESRAQQWKKVFEQIGKMSLNHGCVFEGYRWVNEEESEWVVKGDGGREVMIKTDLLKYLKGEEIADEEDETEAAEG